jgi:hypothetical protein
LQDFLKKSALYLRKSTSCFLSFPVQLHQFFAGSRPDWLTALLEEQESEWLTLQEALEKLGTGS